MAATQPDTTWRDDTEEIRVAIAWNGGVSLAVWMGGVAVELDCARRAFYGAENQPGETPRSVYAELSETLRRRLIPDILTGASAGGLNGALLAGTMRKGRRLPADLLRGKWLSFGDFSKLLRPTEERAPQSLMQGDMFLDEVKLMFAALLGDEQPPPTPHADASSYPQDWKATFAPDPQVKAGLGPFPVLLDVMITNVLGEPQGYVDYWNNELVAREYRAPAKFRKDEDFTTIPLATAARASSSFPAAFEPVKLSGEVAERAGLSAGDVRWAVDGGLLENAPVKYAIDLIPFAQDDRTSRRFLCYLDAAPDKRDPVPTDPAAPNLPAVLGYVVNLPRNARVVDQLYAVEQASRDSGFSQEIQDELFAIGDLERVAARLFDVYRNRRTLLALDELLQSPAKARRIFEQSDRNVPLPWLPQTADFRPNVEKDEWPWGFRAAQRLLLLARDRLLKDGDPREASVRAAKAAIAQEVAGIEELRGDFLQSDLTRGAALRLADADPIDTAAFARLPDLYQKDVAACVTRGLKAYVAASQGQTVAGFVEHGLHVEVIRRAISADDDFETGEQIDFVQLTPVCPCPIFTEKPFNENGPDSPDKKLAGIRLGHFSGFYRRSWRANDFMWGRLDAAVRIVDLMLSDVHARVSDPANRLDAAAIAEALADMLVPDGATGPATDACWLAHEALVDVKSPAADRKIPPEVVQAVAGYPNGDDLPEPAAIRDAMKTALLADLMADAGQALFARTVCARAVQLEILQQELEPLSEQTEVDASLGDFTPPLRLPLGGDSVRKAVVRLRKCWLSKDTYLPKVLGRDSGDESVSNLALETISHAMFVVLSMTRGANAALGRLLGVVRVPLLSISGVASRHRVNRAAVLVSFLGASSYAAARLVQTEPNGVAQVDSLWSGWVLLSWVAALAVLAVAVVPTVRAVRGTKFVRKLGQGAWAAGLVAPLVASIVIAMAWGGIGAIQVVGTPQKKGGPQPSVTVTVHGTVKVTGTAGRSGPVTGTGPFTAQATLSPAGAASPHGSTEAPEWLVWLALGLVFVGVPALRTVKLPIFGAAQNVLFSKLGKLPIAIVLGLVSLAVAGWSMYALVDVLDGESWQIATAAAAFLSFPLCLAYLLFGTQHVRNRRVRDLVR
ncbi:MAG TPA: DUF3376 domain-containing protein [Gaiellaceae bacterium]|nr:DUF3376 domain-containing protein [Gaiellaceae bacterium]